MDHHRGEFDHLIVEIDGEDVHVGASRKDLLLVLGLALGVCSWACRHGLL